jgi:hypothetical protein
VSSSIPFDVCLWVSVPLSVHFSVRFSFRFVSFNVGLFFSFSS